MEITIIAETSGEGLHPVTEQLVGAASSLGGVITVLCPGAVSYTHLTLPTNREV